MMRHMQRDNGNPPKPVIVAAMYLIGLTSLGILLFGVTLLLNDALFAENGPRSSPTLSAIQGTTTRYMEGAAIFSLLGLGVLEVLILWSITRKQIRYRRAQALEHTDHCPRCGYDVRATPLQCPECGTDFLAGAFPHSGQRSGVARKS